MLLMDPRTGMLSYRAMCVPALWDSHMPGVLVLRDSHMSDVLPVPHVNSSETCLAANPSGEDAEDHGGLLHAGGRLGLQPCQQVLMHGIQQRNEVLMCILLTPDTKAAQVQDVRQSLIMPIGLAEASCAGREACQCNYDIIASPGRSPRRKFGIIIHASSAPLSVAIVALN